MLNHAEYEIQNVADMPSNVFVGIGRHISKEHVREEKCKVYKALSNTIFLTASENPQWRFEATYRSYSDGLTDFTVYFKGEKLGDIEYSPRRGKFDISCPAIARTMSRKRFKSVGSERDALKLIKQFAPTPLAERFESARDQTRRAMQSLIYDRRGELDRAMRYVQNGVLSYMMENIEQLRHKLVEHGVSSSLLTDLVEKRGVYEEVADLVEDKTGKNAAVLIRDGLYLVGNPDDPADPNAFHTYTESEALPDRIRMAVGMLKLVQDGQSIAGIGFRYSDDKFLVKLEV